MAQVTGGGGGALTEIETLTNLSFIISIPKIDGHIDYCYS